MWCDECMYVCNVCMHVCMQCMHVLYVLYVMCVCM